MTPFESIDVWRRTESDSLIRYRCFRVHPEGGYRVQSADYYGESNDLAAFERQFMGLL